MLRALFPFLILVIIAGIPAIASGMVFTGQVLFAVLAILFIGTLVDALVDRVQDDQ